MLGLADMVSQILDVLDERSRQIDYSNFGPVLLTQAPSMPESYVLSDDLLGTATHLPVGNGSAASDAAPQPNLQGPLGGAAQLHDNNGDALQSSQGIRERE